MILDGKEKVKYTLDRITLQRLSNLIAGVELGVMQAINVCEFFINSYFVLTDGKPTIPPLVSYEASVNAIFDECPVFGIVSMFGFGHSLYYHLLMQLATMGGGTYSYIPDAGVVGTCFINALEKVCHRIMFKKKVNTKNGYLVPNITVDWCRQTVLHKDELFIKLTPLDTPYGTDSISILSSTQISYNYGNLFTGLLIR